ncbi:MAG TPA: RHS repeat-associated core domain-containing protein [Pedococcus sp.]|jgi:RHS repeat-associated protein|nr:RHS repeat-associated core domain-containing protein [Pedococcus sp.]
MVTTSTTLYDSVGRPTKVTDALGHATTTAYTPADNQATTAAAVTDAKGFTTTTTFDPAYGTPTKSVDANARTTTITLDPLGRTLKVWAANRATYQSPSYQFTYLIRQSGASSVTSSSLHYLGTNRIVTTQLYDGLLRPIQTQTQSGSASRVLTDTIYDTRGLATSNRGPWFSAGLPAADAVTAADASIDKIVTVAYDGAARPTRATTWVLGTEQFHTDTVYNGDSTDTLPPAGGVATRAVIDARGHQTQLWQYHGSVITTAKDITNYTYNNKDQLTAVANQAGITWNYGYNQLGQQTSAVDPDKGSTTTVYDLLGNVTKTTDAAGRVLNRFYDVLNRPLTVTDGSGALQSQWTYDTVAAGKGQLASSTSYSDGAAYSNTINSYDAVYHATGNTITIPASETGLAGSYTYTRAYNVDGSFGYVNMPAAANLSAEQLAYQRDATNLPTNALGSTSIVASSTRDGFGRLTQYTLQSLDVATTVTQSFQTGLGRLATYRVDRANVATADQNATFAYDPAGNITSIADVPDPATPARTDQQCFAYTWDRELSDAWASGASSCSPTPSLDASGAAPYWTSWIYDAAHRRASETRHGASVSTIDTYGYPAVNAPHPNAASSVTTQVGTGTPTTANLGYDPTGNTMTTPLPGGATGSLMWDAQSRLATVAVSGVAGTSSNVYAADGTLLVRRASSGVKTLFLDGDTQITYTPANGTVPASTTALRVFTFEGQVVAYRKADGYAGVVFQPPGYQGTALVQTQGSGSASGVAVRRFTPFGAPRGATAGTWELGRGFLGDTSPTAVTDPGSGLVHLGAREYDPVLGRFLSVDPLMDLTDPTQFNAYGYADNNPISFSDPAGTRPLGRSDTDAVVMSTVGGVVKPTTQSVNVQGWDTSSAPPIKATQKPPAWAADLSSTEAQVAKRYLGNDGTWAQMMDPEHVQADNLRQWAQDDVQQEMCAKHPHDCNGIAFSLAASGLVLVRAKGVSPTLDESGQIVGGATERALGMDVNELLARNLSTAEAAHLADHAWSPRMWIGKALERQVWKYLRADYGDRFTHNPSRGPDFYDKYSSTYVELTTVAGEAPHMARGGAYLSATYALYDSGGLLAGLR